MMRESSLNQPEFIGREVELGLLKGSLSRAKEGNGSTIFIAGEAGIGKTRLVSELFDYAASYYFNIIRGWCLAECLEPLMPVKKALREAGLAHLVSEDPPPRVVSAYLMNDAGMLIAKAERQEGSLDPDIFAGMLQAVGSYVKDSLRGLGNGPGGSLSSLEYADYTILMQTSGKLSVATVIKGRSNEFLMDDMNGTLAHFGDAFDDWKGNMARADLATEKISWFVDSGKYDGRILVDDPKLRQENLFNNVLLGVQRAVAHKPVILFLDDLQWADPTTLDLLHYLARNTRNERVLIIGTYRTEDIVHRPDGTAHQLETAMQNMGGEYLLEKLELKRLDRDSTVALINSALGEVCLGPDFYDTIHKETEGTPFFVLEILKMLVEEGTMAQDHAGTWNAVKGPDEFDLPSKVYDVVKRRLDRLMSEQRDMLECASVIGEEFPMDILERICHAGRPTLVNMLSDAENNHRLLHHRNGRYRFDHAKVREVLLKGMGEELRMEYHKSVADAIIQMHHDRMDDYVNELAHHCYQARDERAGGFLIRAGDKAKEQYANREAMRFYENAFDLVGGMERVHALDSMSDILRTTGEFDKALEKLAVARKLAEELGEVKLCNSLANRMGYMYLEQGSNEKAMAEFDSVIEYARKAGEHDIAADALRNQVLLFLRTGEFDKAIDCGQRVMEHYESMDDQQNLAFIYKDLGDVYGEKGDHDRGLEFYERSIGMFDTERDIYNIASIQMNMGVIYSLKKDWDRAAELYEECIRNMARAGDQNNMAWALFNIAEAYIKTRQFDKAENALYRSAELLERTDDRVGMAGVNMNFGQLFQEMGRFAEAVPHFEGCITTLKELGIPKYLADATHELGLTLKELGSVEEAKARLGEALSIYEELGMERNAENVKGDMENIQ